MTLQVHRAELPDLAPVTNALLEALGLHVHADLKPIFDEDDARANDGPFYQRNILEEILHLSVTGIAHHSLHASAGVPTAVEEHNFTGRGQIRKVALDVHLRLLALGRGRQGYRPEDARARSFGDVLDHTALARGITPLEEHTHFCPARPHPFLELDQL